MKIKIFLLSFPLHTKYEYEKKNDREKKKVVKKKCCEKKKEKEKFRDRCGCEIKKSIYRNNN
jgi:hypothetical protein